MKRKPRKPRDGYDENGKPFPYQPPWLPVPRDVDPHGDSVPSMEFHRLRWLPVDDNFVIEFAPEGKFAVRLRKIFHRRDGKMVEAPDLLCALEAFRESYHEVVYGHDVRVGRRKREVGVALAELNRGKRKADLEKVRAFVASLPPGSSIAKETSIHFEVHLVTAYRWLQRL